MPSKKEHKIISNWILLAAGIVIVAALAVIVWQFCNESYSSPSVVTTSNKNSNANSNTSNTNSATAGWKTYTNSIYGFSFKYPKDLTIKESPRSFSDEILGTFCQTITLNEKSSIIVCDATDNLTNYGLREPNGMDPISSSDLKIGSHEARKYTSSNICYVVLGPKNNRIVLNTTNTSSKNISELETILSTFQFTP